MFMYKGIGLGATASPAATTIANTIVQVEGVNPVYTPNNNPGNLVFANQTGAVVGAGGFAAFPTYTDGYNALLNQIQIYANQGLTIDQMMNKYAPSAVANDPTGVNNPNLYAGYIATALGVPSTTSVADVLAGTVPSGVDDLMVSTGTDDSADSSIFGLDSTTALVAGAAILLLTISLSPSR